MGTITSGCSWLLLLKSKSKWVFVFYRTINYYTISSAGSRNSILQQTLQGHDVSCGLRCKHRWYSHPDGHWSKSRVWWTGRPVSELKKQKRNKQTKRNLVYDFTANQIESSPENKQEEQTRRTNKLKDKHCIDSHNPILPLKIPSIQFFLYRFPQSSSSHPGSHHPLFSIQVPTILFFSYRFPQSSPSYTGSWLMVNNLFLISVFFRKAEDLALPHGSVMLSLKWWFFCLWPGSGFSYCSLVLSMLE